MKYAISLLLLISTVFGEETISEDSTIETTTARPSPEKCFHRPASFCPHNDEPCRCKRLQDDPQAVVCCNVSSSFHLKEGLACLSNTDCQMQDRNGSCVVQRMHIYNATLDEFNIASEQSTLKRVISMSVTDGKIEKIVGEFKRFSSMKCLNLSNNALNEIDKRSFVHLPNLAMLDLSHNNLSEVPNFNKMKLISLDISYNKPLMCRSLMDAMNNTELHFIRDVETYCLFAKTFHWFNTTELIPLRQVKNYNDLEKKSCSDNCTCKAQRLDLVPGKEPTFAVMVDCSGKNMVEMPKTLPPNTIALNISNNNITELKIDGDTYENIRELYADNNQITSILSLEGTKFLENFIYLSLKNNKLKSLPIYMLSNIFDRNSISRSVHLGYNRLQCNCTTAKNLKIWLLTKTKNIPDYNEIQCDNMNTKVIFLESSKLCQTTEQTYWTDYIYYIISGEVLLLVFLVIKVSYDYWVFKTAGYLPWPASKMPKLPCDWICE